MGQSAGIDQIGDAVQTLDQIRGLVLRDGYRGVTAAVFSSPFAIRRCLSKEIHFESEGWSRYGTAHCHCHGEGERFFAQAGVTCRALFLMTG